MSASPFYITTPIYYVTDKPHIGHLYTTVAADIRSRYERMCGKDVWFLTGTDEHGQKIQKKALEEGITPQQLVDRVVQRYQETWTKFEISNDDFIRTTEERHKKVVTQYVKKLMDSGDIFLDSYEGWYCVPDEMYLMESQVQDGKSIESGRPVEWLKEESYFFKMSKYSDALLKHIETHPEFIVPESRKNEVVSFIKMGLKDISMSRTTIQWGIPMPQDKTATKEHKIYVWFDALTNYVSALGPLDTPDKFKKFWPEAIHLVGKDILRFHAIYWPTFLMALGLPLPKQIVAHGWLTDKNRKISKSSGKVVDPMALADTLGVDALRYFLFREFVFGLDGEYTEDTLYQRINSDLANDYGNAVSRVVSMVIKYFGENPLSTQEFLTKPSDISIAAEKAIPLYRSEIETFNFSKALEANGVLISAVNKFIDTEAPWKLAKSQQKEDQERLRWGLIHCLEGLRLASLMLCPFMPKSASKALASLGSLSEPKISQLQWGKTSSSLKVIKTEALFPRIEKPENKNA